MTCNDITNIKQYVFSINFDHTLFIESSLLGYNKSFTYSSLNVVLQLPSKPIEGTRTLNPPLSITTDIKNYLADKTWGILDNHNEVACVEAFSIVVSLDNNIIKTVSDDNKNEEGTNIVDVLNDWYESFINWLYVLTSQSINPHFPNSKTISRKSRAILLAEVNRKGRLSEPKVQYFPISINIKCGDATSERVVNKEVFDLAIDSACQQPPLCLELFASSRLAARRKDFRRALIDAGTAIELALRAVLNIDEAERPLLRELIREAKQERINIPDDVFNSLVTPRNVAVHRAKIQSNIDINRALEITETIINLALPDLIPSNSLKPYLRPQRQDLVFFK